MLLVGLCAKAAPIPSQLIRSDLDEVIDSLVGASTKHLSDPYALGGYDGLEIGFSTEFIDTKDFSSLGDQTPQDSTLELQRLTLGKGLYSNIDIFLHFTPHSRTDRISNYGGTVKWMLFEGNRLPISLSTIAYINLLNLSDQFTSQTSGWDILAGMTLNKFSIYWGGGRVMTNNTFSADNLDCATPPTCSADMVLNAQNTFVTERPYRHTFFGLHIPIQKFFVAAQLDRYENPVYSAKLGYRY